MIGVYVGALYKFDCWCIYFDDPLKEDFFMRYYLDNNERSLDHSQVQEVLYDVLYI